MTLGERLRRFLAVVRDGDDLVSVLEHAPRVEILDPTAAEQRDPRHPDSPSAPSPSHL